MKKKYSITGIDCANCAAKLEAKINEIPGINDATLVFETGQLLIDANDPDALIPAVKALADEMEPGTLIGEVRRGEKNRDASKFIDEDEKKEIVSLLVGIAFFAVGIVCEKLNGRLPLYLAFFIISYLILGGGVLAAAAKNLLKGKVFDENFLMSIATIGAFLIGEYPEAVGVMLFYRIGELFEDIAAGKSRKQIIDALDLRPETIRKINDDGDAVECDPKDAAIGDVIEVRAGDRIALDGSVLRGSSKLDTSAVTGEPMPVSVSEGDSVISGCVNISGAIYVKVEKPLEESMVSRILEAVENAAASKPKIDRFITKFARIYTPIVVAAAILTAIVPSILFGDARHWIYTALTFLVISCPCALVLSVPLAYFAGIGIGSKKGILFKGGVSIEALAGVKTVVFDKTGTITEGDFKVAEIIADGVSNEQLLSYAAAAESLSTHPIAASILKAANEKGVDFKGLIDESEYSAHETPGKGMDVELKAGRLLCGNKGLLDMNGVRVPDSDKDRYGTEALLALNGKYIGRIVINDAIKSDSKNAIEEIKKHHIKTAMLTGDTDENAKRAAKMVGIDEVYARQLPQDKLNTLNKIRKEHGATMFVGDGINDAPVLAGADVGAAMGSGADAAIEAADVVFMNSRLGMVPESIRIAKRTKTTAMQNIIGALIVKAFIMVLGFLGMASMWMAVFADSGVAMLCVINSIRSLFAKERAPKNKN